jgi:hypothetical protein
MEGRNPRFWSVPNAKNGFRADSKSPIQYRLGYFFHSRSYPNAPGHPQLDIVLRPVPTHLHFDPEWVRLKVASAQGGTETLTVHHPWRGLGRRYRACAGQVTWGDRKNKTVEAFTFGGALRIDSETACTICRLTSSAPIIYMIRRFSIPTTLALEVQVLLAKRRAAWVNDPEAFEGRLVAAEPLVLYRACLETLLTKARNFPSELANERLERFLHFLDSETRVFYAHRHPSTDLPTLLELL